MDAQEQRDRLKSGGRFPRMEYSEMDFAYFYFSFEYYGEGEKITFEGHDYEVDYSWVWMKFKNGLEIYVSEVEPVRTI